MMDREEPLTSRGAARRRFLCGTGAATTGLATSSFAGAAVAAPSPASASSTSDAIGAAVPVRLNINGHDYDLVLEPRVTLLDALREYVGLAGTKKGCDRGQCGACTVLVNDRRINACLALAVAHVGNRIRTIEGLASGAALHPMQAAFIAHDGFQCGYCTPGQICSAVGLIAEGRARTADEIRELMSGNICRCGAYPNIVAAIEQVMAGKGAEKSAEVGR